MTIKLLNWISKTLGYSKDLLSKSKLKSTKVLALQKFRGEYYRRVTEVNRRIAFLHLDVFIPGWLGWSGWSRWLGWSGRPDWSGWLGWSKWSDWSGWSDWSTCSMCKSLSLHGFFGICKNRLTRGRGRTMEWSMDVGGLPGGLADGPISMFRSQ